MKSRILKELLNSNGTLIMPDAYDPISAKLIENAGFKAVQCSGYSFSIQAGYPSEMNVMMNDNIEWTRRIVESVDIPVMADAEDGYGGPEKVRETVEKFINVGVAGLNIEDQVHDDKKGLSIVSEDTMIAKIIAAKETAELKGKSDFIVNGRSDALKSTEDRLQGLGIAIDRVNQYLEAGADLGFITYVETLDEVKTIMNKVKGPVSIAAGMPYNIKEFSIDDLVRQGVARISLPTLLILSSINALSKSLDYLNEDNLKEMGEGMLYPVNNLNNILNK